MAVGSSTLCSRTGFRWTGSVLALLKSATCQTVLGIGIEYSPPCRCCLLGVTALVQYRRDSKSGIDVVLIMLGSVLKIMCGVLDAPEVEIQKSSLVPCVGVRLIDLQSGIQRLLRLLRPCSGRPLAIKQVPR